MKLNPLRLGKKESLLEKQQTVYPVNKIDYQFNAKSSTAPQQTCSPVQQVQRQSFIDFMLGRRQYNLATYQIIQYYCLVAPLADGVDRIAEGVGAIPPLIFDKKENAFVQNHPLQQLLDNPNFGMDWNAFAISYASFLILSGNSYFIANSIGDMNSEPRSLFIIHPQDVTINESSGMITSYDVTEDMTQKTYSLVKSTTGNPIRYISEQDGLVSELFHSRQFNPQASGFGLIGKSKLNSIYYEVEQYIAQSVHNLSGLKRGTSLDGVFKHEKVLSQDQQQQLKAELDAYYSGENNNGRLLVLQNGLDYIPNQRRVKDMDFEKLADRVTKQIYNRLKIPLPNVSTETMTFSNMEAAELKIYDSAILPATNFMMSQLTTFLMPRYKNSENLKVWYDDGDISALEPRRNEQLKAKKDLNVYTINEIREMDRATGLNGGDNLYGQATEVPIANDPEGEFSDSDFDNGSQDQEEDQSTDDTAKFIGLLKGYKDEKGESRFSHEEIEKYAQEHREWLTTQQTKNKKKQQPETTPQS